MSIELISRLILSTVLSLIVAWKFYSQEKKENLVEEPKDGNQRYLNIVPVGALPLVLLSLFIVLTHMYGLKYSFEIISASCFSLFVHISLFYLILLLCMPWIRKRFSARTCATLWMIPNYAYIFQYVSMSAKGPLVVMSIPSNIVKSILVIWLIGFFCVFSYYVIQHLLFKYRILKKAIVITDEAIIEIWNKEREYANIYKKYPLYISTETETPLSIGLFKITTKVVLPEKEYSEEELHLIFQHELIHIGREDSSTKFFMMFCTAICWFNPLMWIAMRHSADDLELSCDETVLIAKEDTDRKKYAELILRTAGPQQGFTTCLSATAEALQYRLRNLMIRRNYWNSGVLIGIVLFVFMFTSSNIAFAYEENTGAEALGEYTVESVYLYDNTEGYLVKCVDKDALKTYLANLELKRVTGNYTFDSDKLYLSCTLGNDEEFYTIMLTDYGLRIRSIHDRNAKDEKYYLKSEIDWDYLKTLMTN